MPRPAVRIVYANADAEKNQDRGINVVDYARPLSAGYVERTKTAPKTYEELLDQMRGSGRLWEDPDFPADTSSVFPSKTYRNFDWKRPTELVDSPRLFEGGTSRFDIKQGELGDCWVLASLASLCGYPTLLKRVVPEDQDFDENYIGAFRFYFWKFGDWKEVIVDDRLPTNRGQLCFMHSAARNEFWSALIEKAYAKFYTSYEALSGGSQAEAMVDFTGGLCETIYLDNNPPNLFDNMYRNLKKSSLMGCSIDPPEDGQIEAKVGQGLIAGHAYSVTDVKKVEINGEEHRLVRVRNPWGNSEWTGAWSDQSDEWNGISDEEREDLGLVFSDDGEFWMSIQDFDDRFSKLECCHLDPENFNDEDSDKGHWEMTVESGKWERNVNAGGCRNFLDSFWTNPQYQFILEDSDLEDDIAKGQILIGLMQKDMRAKRVPFLTIGYSIYKLRDDCPSGTRLTLPFFRMNRAIARSEYGNCREVTGYHTLDPGTYVVIPSTFRPNEEAEFQIRVFCEKKPDSCEMDNGDKCSEANTEDLIQEDPNDVAARQAKLKQKFIDIGDVVTCDELHDVINYALTLLDSKFPGFTMETCQSMIELMDTDGTGRMELNEFMVLWKSIRIWTAIFIKHDANESGDFDSYELRMALRTAGYVLSNRVFAIVAKRYTNDETGTIPFGNFITCLVRLKNAFKDYERQLQESGFAQLNDAML